MRDLFLNLIWEYFGDNCLCFFLTTLRILRVPRRVASGPLMCVHINLSPLDWNLVHRGCFLVKRFLQ